MKFLKKLGFPLLFASIIGFKLAARGESSSFYYVSGGLMIAGMFLVVGSIFIRSDDDGPAEVPLPLLQSGTTSLFLFPPV